MAESTLRSPTRMRWHRPTFTLSTRSRIVGKATRGEVLRTLERRSQWVKVQQDGGPRGWVARRLLWGW